MFGAPDIREEEIAEVDAVMRSGWLGTGPRVARFENAFAAYRGCRNAVAVNSCTAALHLSMLASNVGPGDEVITTAMTFCATVNAIVHTGATPVLVDIDPETLNIDPAALDAAITPRTKAVLVVHFAGRPCAMDVIMSLAEANNLKVIEDCALAIETEYQGKAVGTFGDFGCFSFYVTKSLVTVEGGMVLAQREADAGRIKVLAMHGMSQDAWRRYSDDGYRHYQVVECGFKYNMTDMQAAIGIHQLARIAENWLRRERIWQRYMDAFSHLPLGLPAPIERNTRHAYHLFTVRIDDRRVGIDRDEFMRRLTQRNIGVGVHYLSIPEHRVYRERFGWSSGDFPEAWRFGQETLSLPLSAGLSDDDVEDVITAVREIAEA